MPQAHANCLNLTGKPEFVPSKPAAISHSHSDIFVECCQYEDKVTRVPEEKRRTTNFNKIEERLYPPALSSLHFGAVDSINVSARSENSPNRKMNMPGSYCPSDKSDADLGGSSRSTEDEKFYVPETCRPRILRLYHDSAESGGRGGFSNTHRKIKQRFSWESMKKDVHDVRTCHLCQMAKAKYKPRGSKMVILMYWNIPFQVVHLDFAEVKKKEGVRKTQVFLVAVDEHTTMAAAKCGKEDANSVIALMERAGQIKCWSPITDLLFIVKKLRKWAE